MDIKTRYSYIFGNVDNIPSGHHADNIVDLLLQKEVLTGASNHNEKQLG